jgi:L-amino acid N-acyltransferase YncA
MHKIKSYWKQHGTLELLSKVVLRVRSFDFSYRPLYFYRIMAMPQIMVKPLCPLEIREGTLEDIDLMVEMLKYKYMDGAVAREWERYLFDKGGEVFLAFSEGNLVHIAWLFCSPGIREPDYTVKIKQDEAFISSCDTHPESRGKNIYPAVLQHIVGYATAKNKKRCFISTAPTNLASIKGIEKAGFSFVGKIRQIRLFGMTFNNRLGIMRRN